MEVLQLTFWKKTLRPVLRHLKSVVFPRHISLNTLDVEAFNTSHFIERFTFEEEGYSQSVREPLNPRFLRRHSFADRGLWWLRGVVFHPKRGLISTGRALIQDAKTNGAREDRKPFFSWPRKVEDDSWWLPVGHKPWNYYHWLLEDFPVVLRAVGQNPRVNVAVSTGAPGYVSESLSLLGVEYSEYSGSVRFQKTILPGRGIDPGWPHRSDMKRIIHFASSVSSGLETARGPRRLFVSRRQSTRGATNEKLLEELAVHHDFQVVLCEELGFLEQVKLFSSAEIVMGTHGAGLSNFVFSKPGSVLCEIADPRRPDPCFENLAICLEREYRRFFAAPGNVLDSSAVTEPLLRDIEQYLKSLGED